jgi:serine palmitoyltransferase small subunit-like protein
MESTFHSRKPRIHEHFSYLRRSLGSWATNVAANNALTTSEKQQTSFYDYFLAFWEYLCLQHYRFEVTYSVYILEPAEKVAFYVIVLLFAAAIAALIYYPLRYLGHVVDPRSCLSLVEGCERGSVVLS